EQRVKSVMEFDNYNVYKLKQSKDFYQQFIQNTLQLNNGNGTFSEVAYYSGVDATDWSWAGLLFDMDNDGLRDIFITNGINHDLTDLDFVDFFANEIIQKMALTGRKESIDSIIAKMPIKPQPNYAYRNKGDIRFDNANKDWGFELPSMSNGAAYGDLDNDGDLDLVINNVNATAFIYENQTDIQTDHHYLKLKFKGSEKNPFGIGASIMLYYDDKIVVQEMIPSRGFQSSMEYGMTIGLGTAEQIDSLRVLWPDDRSQKFTGITADQTLVLDYTQADETFSWPKENIDPLLQSLDNNQLVAHQENTYNDFDYEGLIYTKLSQEGPSLAVGDIDGDGNEDVFIGGASDQQAMLYRHTGNGKLSLTPQVVFREDAEFEDTAAAFLDADSDGDMDLMVGSGGNEVGRERGYRTRLYLNDGAGNYSRSKTQIPSTTRNTSVIAPEDFDGDGDIDVFIGSRSVVGTYGVDPNHLFLENVGNGAFEDATERLGYDLTKAGMVTDAIWSDVTGDNKKDLITTSDWGTPIIFNNSGRRISRLPSDLDSLSGWWLTVEAADLDADGDQDLILGNMGENLHYQPRHDAPMKMWVNDYDNNGTLEQLVSLQENGEDYPIHQKKEITAQMVSLKKANLKASEYASKTVQGLFSEEILGRSIVREVNTASSVVAINDGQGKFTIKHLPQRVQLSCVCDISCIDINKDGHLDLIMGGNNFEFKPQYSQLDASLGHVLLGDGAMNFEWQPYTESGFAIKEEIKHLSTFRDASGKEFVIAAINDTKPRVFALK
ncbi:MAG: VCBS repeat-containing protein, partial [Flavobacteriaceae bacterium]|nr:VCBS repeat-containing protein [Flavobacteriaceae bacterium]